MTIYQSTAYRLRQLFSTLAAATASNPVLLEGEKWHEKDAATGRATGRTKTGDGSVTSGGTAITGTAFNDLPFDPAGPALSDAIPQAPGTASAGTSATASRSDHRHAMPSAADVGADATGTAAAAVAAHTAAADPHPVYTTAQEAAAAAPVQSVAGRNGAVSLAVADVSGAVSTTDSRLSDAREWSASTATQAEAEAGTSTSRLAFTPQRVFQAIAAWWSSSAAAAKLATIASGATANATDAQLRDRSTHTGTQPASTITGLAAVATSGAYADLSGRPTLPSGALVGTTDTQTLTNKTLGNIQETVFTITDAAGFEINPANGPIQLINLGANRTPAATNFAAGQSVTLMIDDGTNYAITWTTVAVTWVGGSAPTLATTGRTVIELWKVGSTIYGALVGTVA